MGTSTTPEPKSTNRFNSLSIPPPSNGDKVPIRFLYPSEFVQYINNNLQSIIANTNANIRISKDGETPSTLSDKIVIINGDRRSKETCLYRILSGTLQQSMTTSNNPLVFIIIVPHCCVSFVIGPKGILINDISRKSNSQINVNKEGVIGLTDRPITISSDSIESITDAVIRIHDALETLVETNKVSVDDFKLNRPIPTSMRVNASGGVNCDHIDKTQVTRMKMRILTNIGDNININRFLSINGVEGVFPAQFPLNPKIDRIIVIGSVSYGQKNEAVEQVIRSLNEVSSTTILVEQRSVKFLIGKGGQNISNISNATGASVIVQKDDQTDSRSYRHVCISGNISSRIGAVKMLMVRLEELAMDDEGIKRVFTRAGGKKQQLQPESPLRENRENIIEETGDHSNNNNNFSILLPDVIVCEWAESGDFSAICKSTNIEIEIGEKISSNSLDRRVILIGGPEQISRAVLLLQDKLISVAKSDENENIFNNSIVHHRGM